MSYLKGTVVWGFIGVGILIVCSRFPRCSGRSKAKPLLWAQDTCHFQERTGLVRGQPHVGLVSGERGSRDGRLCARYEHLRRFAANPGVCM